jgi:hypothetical protein
MYSRLKKKKFSTHLLQIKSNKKWNKIFFLFTAPPQRRHKRAPAEETTDNRRQPPSPTGNHPQSAVRNHQHQNPAAVDPLPQS